MIWSKKMRVFQDRLAPSLKGRLSIKTAGYRDAYEERGRSWVEYDGKEILAFCDFRHENRWRELGRDLDAVQAEGVYSKQDFGVALGQFIDSKIEEALASENPLVRALAMVDRRVGRRRLVKLSKEQIEGAARALLEVRLIAERIGVRKVQGGCKSPFPATLDDTL